MSSYEYFVAVMALIGLFTVIYALSNGLVAILNAVFGPAPMSDYLELDDYSIEDVMDECVLCPTAITLEQRSEHGGMCDTCFSKVRHLYRDMKTNG